ncbi:hypothetical protein A6A04_14245 [Paramagnetospirillum marisnigri]|uniref:HTH gntR-type domain-containing protein n=1 Tax=Paramagnetospirillum marisnigri TaxID=1285242 RepID=A0A178MVQ8_9PROT|nr:GntR family transcriptional regulator [Paramagnetospirillum marisnigri]OAN53120.1 hypothetical protein A6A04_14245 [Paramagnetospirillum marisnigri]
MTTIASKPSKAEQVRGVLMAEILAGRRLPGEKLGEEEIAARHHCSRTPVREALRHLNAIGLVHFRPRHGATVAAPDTRAMQELRDAMAELESVLAELVAGHLSEDAQDRLRRLMTEGGGVDEVLDILHAAVGNPVLVELASSLRQRFKPRWSPDGLEKRGLLRPVVDALMAGDGARARVAMRDMILSSARHNCPDHAPPPP